MSTAVDNVKKSALHEITPDEVVNMIAVDMLRQFYGTNPDLDPLIETAYAKMRNGASIMARNVDEPYKSIALIGPGGHGKTSSYKAAAKLVAKMLNLRLVDRVQVGQELSKSDFYFVVQDMSGEASNVEFGGIMDKRKLKDGSEYMTKLLNYRLAVAKQAGATLMLLDDFTNAAPFIQNTGLSIVQRRSFQDLDLGPTVYVGITGNQGAKDNSYATAMGSPLSTRCKVFYLEDKVEDFTVRAMQRYGDAIGDAGVIGYLKRRPGAFDVPSKEKGVPYPCPRTWDAAMSELRYIKNDAVSSKLNVSMYRTEMENNLGGVLGVAAANDFVAYMHQLWVGADPMAHDLIEKGQLDEAKFTEKAQSFLSAAEVDFGFQFGSALADYAAAAMIRNEGDYAKPLANFAQGLARLNPTMVTYAVDLLQLRLVHQSKTLSESIGLDGAVKRLTLEVSKDILSAVAAAPGANADMVNDVKLALAGTDKFGGTDSKSGLRI